jgi:hypothetical protein
VSDDIPEWERKLLANKPAKQHRDAVFTNVVNINKNQDIRAYSLKALTDELHIVANAPEGTRNSTDLSLQVDNIVAACRLIREHGGRIVAEPGKREGEPIVLAIFADPEGNEVMLTQWVGH